MLIMFTVTASWGVTINSILMALAGAFNCGPDSILGEEFLFIRFLKFYMKTSVKVLMYVHTSNSSAIIHVSVGLIPTELGEKDGRNAGAAVTGLVNGRFQKR